MRKQSLPKLFLYAALILAVVTALFPYLWTFLAATHTNSQVFNFSYTFRFGTNIIQNYNDLLARIPLWSNLYSSMFIAVVYTVIILLIDAMAGYGFSQFQFKGPRHDIYHLLGGHADSRAGRYGAVIYPVFRHAAG